ncbi:MAG: hypothetical protein ACTHKC_09210 [Candidatus Nitrosocosmicus sp.]
MTAKTVGYSLERYSVLTLEFNGYHVKRNALSYGIEDIIAYNGKQMLLVQVKNIKAKGRHAMTKEEQLILKKHAQEINAIPIYLYWEDGKKHWVNLLTNDYFDISPYTKTWYTNRQYIKKQLKEQYKINRKNYKKFILENWNVFKDYIC